MRKLFLIIIAFIALVTFIRTFNTSALPLDASNGAVELIENN
jgi:hypothetical protein